MPTLFTRIIAGEIPSFKVYEDDYTFAFLDIFPQTPGHTLIVPKIECDHFSEVPEPYYSAIFATAKKLAPILQRVTNCARISAKFEGFEVPHCHFHLIPSASAADANFKSVPRADESELAHWQQRILSELS